MDTNSTPSSRNTPSSNLGSKLRRLKSWRSALAAVLLCSGCGQTDCVEVEQGDIVHSFVAQGRVESDLTIEIFPEVTARIEQVHVSEGDPIDVGQVLVTLESDRLQAAHQQALHAAESAKASFDQLRRGTRPELLEKAKAVVDELTAAAAAAESQLSEVLRGARSEDIRNAEKLLEAAQADEQLAAKQYRRARNLEGTISASELDTFHSHFDGAVALRESRQAQLDRLQAGAADEERAQARSRVASAKARLRQAKAEFERLTTGPTAEELRLAEAQYEQAVAVLDHAKIELADASVRSPVKGVVLRRYREPGELVHPQMQQAMLVVCNDAARQVRIEVAEGDVYKLSKGLRAVITSDGYVGKQWEGRVSKIASVMGRKRLFSERPTEKVDVKVLEAWITLDKSLSLPINLPVEVRVDEVILKDVLVLPSRAVNHEGWLLRPGGERQQVVLGARDDGFVQIVSGLAQGDRVAVR